MRHRARVIGLALAAVLAWQPAAAEDVIEWAPPDAMVVVAFRGFGLLADMLDTVEKRFGDEPSVARAVKGLRAWTPLGLRPGARKWDKGLALERGAGLFSTGPKHLRLVLGADDAERARARLVEIARELGGGVEATEAGLRLGGLELNCALRGGFLVCDSGAVPDQPPGRPKSLDGAPVPTDGLFFLRVGGEFVRAVERDAPFGEVWVALEDRDGEVRLSAEVKLQPMVLGPLAILQAGEGRTVGLETVDARSPGVLKLSFDGPRLLGGAEALARGPVPPPFAPLWNALKTGWSGDLVFSMAGGYLHPVVAIGLTKPEAGAAIIDAAKGLAAGAGVKITTEPAGAQKVSTLVIEAQPDGGEPMRIRVRYGTCGDALVLALAAPDVARCVQGSGQPAKLPERFAAKGTHGLLVWDALSLFGGGLPRDLVEIEAAHADLIGDAMTVLGVYAHLLDELGTTARVQADGVRFELWWRLL